MDDTLKGLRNDINKYMVILNILSQSEELDALAEGKVEDFEDIVSQVNKEDILCTTLRKKEAEIRPRIREIAKSLSQNAKARMQAEDAMVTACEVENTGTLSETLGEEDSQICTRNRELAKSFSHKVRKRMQAEDNETSDAAMQEVTDGEVDATETVKTIGEVRSRIGEITKFLSQKGNLMQAEDIVKPDGAMQLSETLGEEEAEIRVRIREIAKSLSQKGKRIQAEGIIKPEAAMEEVTDGEVDATDKLAESLGEEEVEIRSRIREIAKSLSEKTKQRMQVEDNLKSNAEMEEITDGEVNATHTLRSVAEVRSRIREIAKSLAQKARQRVHAESTIKSDEAMATTSQVIATDTVSETLGEEEVEICQRMREIAKSLSQKARLQMQAEGNVKPNASMTTTSQVIATDTVSETLGEEEEAQISPRIRQISKSLTRQQMQAEGNVIPNASVVPTFEVKATVAVSETLSEETQICQRIREIAKSLAAKTRKQMQTEGNVKSNASKVPTFEVKATVTLSETLGEEELKMRPVITDTAKPLAQKSTQQMQAESIAKPNASKDSGCEVEATDTLSETLDEEEDVGISPRIIQIAKSLAPRAKKQMQAESIVKPNISMGPACEVEATDVLSEIVDEEEVEMRLRITEIAKFLVEKARKQIRAEGIVKPNMSMAPACEVEATDTLSKIVCEEEVEIGPRITEIDKFLVQKVRHQMQAESNARTAASASEIESTDALVESLGEEQQVEISPRFREIATCLAQKATQQMQSESIAKPNASMDPGCEVEATDVLSEIVDEEEVEMRLRITEIAKFLVEKARHQMQAESNARTAASASEIESTDALVESLCEEQQVEISPRFREIATCLAQKATQQMQSEGIGKVNASMTPACEVEATDTLSKIVCEEEVEICPRITEIAKSLVQNARHQMQAESNARTAASASEIESTDALVESLGEEHVEISPRFREIATCLAQKATQQMQSECIGKVNASMAPAREVEATDTLSKILDEEEVEMGPRITEITKSLVQKARHRMQSEGNVKTALEDECTNALTGTLCEKEEAQISPRIREIDKYFAQKARQQMEAEGNVKTIATASEDESTNTLSETLGEDKAQNSQQIREIPQSLAQDARQWMQAKGNVKTVAPACKVEPTNTLSETSEEEEEAQISRRFREIAKSLAQEERQWMQGEGNLEPVATASKIEYTDALSETLGKEEAQINPRFREIAKSLDQKERQLQTESIVKPNELMAPTCEVESTDTLSEILGEERVEIGPRISEIAKPLTQETKQWTQGKSIEKSNASVDPACEFDSTDTLSESLGEEEEAQISPRISEAAKSLAQEARHWMKAEGNMKPVATASKVESTDSLGKTLGEEEEKEEAQVSPRFREMVKSLAQEARQWLQAEGNMKPLATASKVESTNSLGKTLGGEEEAQISPGFREMVKCLAQEARQWLQAEGNMKPLATVCEVVTTNTPSETLSEDETQNRSRITEIAKSLVQKAPKQMQAESIVNPNASVDPSWEVEATDELSKPLGEEDVGICPRIAEIAKSLAPRTKNQMQAEGTVKLNALMTTACEVEVTDTLSETLGEEKDVGICPRITEIAKSLAPRAKNQMQAESIVKPNALMALVCEVEVTDTLSETLGEAEVGIYPRIREMAKSLSEKARKQIQAERNVKTATAASKVEYTDPLNKTLDEEEPQISPTFRDIAKSLAQEARQQMQAEGNLKTVARTSKDESTDALPETLGEDEEAQMSPTFRDIAKSLAQEAKQQMQAKGDVKNVSSDCEVEATNILSETSGEEEAQISPRFREIAKSFAEEARQWMQAERSVKTVTRTSKVEYTYPLNETLGEEEVQISPTFREIDKSLAEKAEGNLKTVAKTSKDESTDALPETLGEYEEAQMSPRIREIAKSLAQEARQQMQSEGDVKTLASDCEVEATNRLSETLGEDEEAQISPRIREITKSLAEKAREQIQTQGNLKTVATASEVESIDALSKILGDEEDAQISPRFREMVKSLAQEAREWQQVEGNMKPVATVSKVDSTNALCETLGEEEKEAQINPRFREIAKSFAQKATEQMQTENNAIVKTDSAIQAIECELDATDTFNEAESEISPKITEIVKSSAQKETQQMQTEGNVNVKADTTTVCHFDTNYTLSEAFSEVEAEFSLRIREIAKSLAQKVVQRMQAEAKTKTDAELHAAGCQLNATYTPSEAESHITPTITEINETLAQNAIQAEDNVKSYAAMQTAIEYKLNTGDTASSEAEDTTNPAKEVDPMTSTIIQGDDAQKESNNIDNNIKYSSFDYSED